MRWDGMGEKRRAVPLLGSQMARRAREKARSQRQTGRVVRADERVQGRRGIADWLGLVLSVDNVL